jgi:Skp family chaperone for outer membrane proteins
MRLVPLLAVLALFASWAAPAEAASKVAVVDLVACMTAHPETKRIEDRFRAAQQRAQDNLGSQEKRLKELRQALDEMVDDHPDRPLKERQYELQMNSAKFNFEWDMKTAVIEYVRGLESIYNAVQGEVSRYARENAIEVVLTRTDHMKPINAVDPKDFALKTRLRVVLYADPRTDITDAIVKILEGK